MDNIEFMKTALDGVTSLDHELYEKTMLHSQGAQIMSPEDMKLAIIAMRGMIKTQQRWIDTLTSEVTLLKTPKKTIWQKLFKK